MYSRNIYGRVYGVLYFCLDSFENKNERRKQPNKQKTSREKKFGQSNSVNKYFIMTISDENFENYVAEFSTALRKISAERWFDNQ